MFAGAAPPNAVAGMLSEAGLGKADLIPHTANVLPEGSDARRTALAAPAPQRDAAIALATEWSGREGAGAHGCAFWAMTDLVIAGPRRPVCLHPVRRQARHSATSR